MTSRYLKHTVGKMDSEPSRRHTESIPNQREPTVHDLSAVELEELLRLSRMSYLDAKQHGTSPFSDLVRTGRTSD